MHCDFMHLCNKMTQEDRELERHKLIENKNVTANKQSHKGEM